MTDALKSSMLIFVNRLAVQNVYAYQPAPVVKNNALIGLLIKKDVDTDGDKVLDAMSAGMGFTAVPCKIAGK